jgi:ribonuclease BN (tRNA processing enzyme)
VCSLARRADLLGCEAAFLSADADQAAATRHLTAAACVEIARDAGAERLLAFHFSRRYSRHPEAVGRELLQAARGTALEGKLVGLPSLVRR